MKFQILLIQALILAAAPLCLAKMHEFNLDEKDSLARTAPVRVEVNDTIRLTLSENPSTGFTWHYQTPKGYGVANNSVVEVDIDTHRAARQENGIQTVGQAGTRIIQLRAVKPGNETLDLVYVRPW